MMILAFTLVGLIAGWIASLIIKDRHQSLIEDISFGVLGALTGGLIANSWGITAYGFWSALGFSAFGAALFIFLLIRFSDNPKVYIKIDKS